MIKPSILIACVAYSLVGGLANAQGNAFVHFDRDKSGAITAGEISEQRDGEIIDFMDANKDGSVTPDEWRTEGRGASFIERGGVDDRGVTRRWIEFNVVFFEFKADVISTNWMQGQAPLAPDASAQDVAKLRESLNARYTTPPESYAGARSIQPPKPST
jgi:EF hand